MIYDYVIYGGGPSGLTLAYILSLNSYKVALVERNKQLGGCWSNIYIDGKYFSEHSPRVVTKDNSILFKILEHINYDYKNKMKSIYGSYYETHKKILSYFYKNFTTHDIIQLTYGYVFNMISKNETLEEWTNRVNISEHGKIVLNSFSLLISGLPSSKILCNEIITLKRSFPLMFLQFTDNSWLELLEETLIKHNVDIYSGVELRELILDDKKNKIISGILSNNHTIIGKEHLCCISPHAFLKFLENQNNKIKNNWYPYPRMKNILEYSSYGSIGFQFHFTEKVNTHIFNEWCKTCTNEYNLIILKVSDYLQNYSKDPNIKEVWSCCIVDTNMYIKKFNKTINELRLQEITNDIVSILHIKPYKITYYPNIHKENNIYKSNESSFGLTKYGLIPSKGKIKNLHAISLYNSPEVATINKACNNSYNWLIQNKINVNIIENKNNIKSYKIYIITIIILILLGISILVIKKYYK